MAACALTPAAEVLAERALVRTGQTDPRTGYKQAGFEAQTVRISDQRGQPLSLAALAANPPLGLPALAQIPPADLISLGRRLFFDRRLAANQTLSCGMCHVPEQAFTQNELTTPVGIEGRFVRRNAPALYNVAYRQRLFHDGRESSLTEQIFSPLLAANEMGNPSRAAVLARIAELPEYVVEFDRLFADGLSEASLGQALAAYQSALLSADSPFDRWFYAGNRSAMDEEARAGFFLFVATGCNRCHTFSSSHAHFTDDRLHRTGVEYASRSREALPSSELQVAPGVIIPQTGGVPAPARNDFGLEEVTGEMADRFRYRTPSLRNVALSAPYMHDGSLASLADVVAFYNTGAGADPDRDSGLQPLGLTPIEQQALIAFLHSLTGANVDALAADARSVPTGERSASAEGSDDDRD
jgi:cytochrome c peroxidase